MILVIFMANTTGALPMVSEMALLRVLRAALLKALVRLKAAPKVALWVSEQVALLQD